MMPSEPLVIDGIEPSEQLVINAVARDVVRQGYKGAWPNITGKALPPEALTRVGYTTGLGKVKVGAICARYPGRVDDAIKIAEEDCDA